MRGSAEGPVRLVDLAAGPVQQVAPRLLGAVLRHDHGEGPVAVRITEVEAYGGTDDPGSHAHRGRTARNAVMFGPPGHLYVYFTYGMHHCCNVVTGPAGEPGAVLLRAGEVVEGWEAARLRRRSGTNRAGHGPADRDLARGPARLCVALGLDRTQDGSGLTAPPLTLLPAAQPATAYETGPRVGLRGAPDRPWRFWLPGEPTVSDYRPASARRARP